MKKCTKCKKLKKPSEYNKNKGRKDGLNTICRSCSNARSKRYYQENKSKHKKVVGINRDKYRKEAQEWIVQYLASHPCVDCGETDLVVLEFDHVRGKKICEVSLMVKNVHSLSNIKKEVAKCDVRCANCHRRKTAKDQKWFKWATSINSDAPGF